MLSSSDWIKIRVKTFLWHFPVWLILGLLMLKTEYYSLAFPFWLISLPILLQVVIIAIIGSLITGFLLKIKFDIFDLLP
jgi:uncharacterized integral membrane protein